MIMLCYPEGDDRGKSAQTSFSALYENEKYVIGLAFPKTGRQHQIRSHGAHHGFPLVGDKPDPGGKELFGRFKDENATKEDHDLMQIPRHALHALALGINLQGEQKKFIGQFPQDFKDWMAKYTEAKVDEVEAKAKLMASDYISSSLR